MIYLAAPYSHPDPWARDLRYAATCEAAAGMLEQGRLVYSPTAHGHALAARGLPGDWAFWADHSRSMLSRCDGLDVLALPGWEESEGVHAEIAIARRLGLPVRLVAPDGKVLESA